MGVGLDINGSVYMTGGTVLIRGPVANNNGALDYGGVFEINGGWLVAAGSAGAVAGLDTVFHDHDVRAATAGGRHLPSGRLARQRRGDLCSGQGVSIGGGELTRATEWLDLYSLCRRRIERQSVRRALHRRRIPGRNGGGSLHAGRHGNLAHRIRCVECQNLRVGSAERRRRPFRTEVG